MTLKLEKPVLLIIDVQKGFDDKSWGKRNNPEAEKNISSLISKWRAEQWKIVFIQHMSQNPKSPLYPGQEGNDYKDIVAPLDNDIIFYKNVHSAFIGTELEEFLRSNDYNQLVIVGITTNFCVATTTRMAGDLGFDTYVVNDATACFDKNDITGNIIPAETIHSVTLANLHEEFATILNTKDFL